MNNKEITDAILKDLKTIKKLTINRLRHEYDRERKKLKIKTEEAYIKLYDITTEAGIKWIFRIAKCNLFEQYLSIKDAEYLNFIYYESDQGLRVCSISPDGYIVVFNRHLFQRYRERMNLDIPNLIDVVKCFLKNNYAVTYNVVPEKDGVSQFLGVVTEGTILGEFIKEDKWYENKTFISNATKGFKATEFEANYLNVIKHQLLKLDSNKDHEKFLRLMKIYRALVPIETDELLK